MMNMIRSVWWVGMGGGVGVWKGREEGYVCRRGERDVCVEGEGGEVCVWNEREERCVCGRGGRCKKYLIFSLSGWDVHCTLCLVCSVN